MDQGLAARTDDGVFYWAYGGDLAAEGTPSDANFCMNGLVTADRKPKPQLYEVKHVYQNITMELADYGKGLVRIRNKYHFTDLKDFLFRWDLEGNGHRIASGTVDGVGLAPQEEGIFQAGFPPIDEEPGTEYFLNLYAFQAKDEGLLKAGTLIARDQVRLPFSHEDETGAWIPLQPSARPGDIRFVDQNGDGQLDNDDKVMVGTGNRRHITVPCRQHRDPGPIRG